MSDWFITPAIENAVLILATIPTPGEQFDQDEELDWAPKADWATTADLLKSILQQDGTTNYLFFDPPEAEDDTESCVQSLPAELAERLAVAAQPFGTLSARLSGCMRRIYSRNETRRAVAVLAGEAHANLPSILFALEALQTRCDVVLGISQTGQITLLGTAGHQPTLLHQLRLGPGSDEATDLGLAELLRRLREANLRHEVLPHDLTN